LSDVVLANLEKGHTKVDVAGAITILRHVGIAPRPTFVPFTPWSTLDDYLELLDFLEAHDLVDHVDPVQLTIRLLVPPRSLLLTPPRARRPTRRPPRADAVSATPARPAHGATAHGAVVLLSGAYREPVGLCGASGGGMGLTVSAS